MSALEEEAVEIQVDQLEQSMELKGETTNLEIEPVAKEDKETLLRKVDEFITSFSQDFVTIYLDSEDPILNVLPIKSDPFYTDRSTLHANVHISDLGEIEFFFLAPNRDIFGERILVNDLSSVMPMLLTKLTSADMHSCAGFDEQDSSLGNLFQRLRKSDFALSLIEKYNGSIVYRSRSCEFVFVKNNEVNEQINHPYLENQCQSCQKYLLELDKKYMSGRLLEIPTTAMEEDFVVDQQPPASPSQDQPAEESPVKRKRGRPKGSKNKNYLEDVKTEEDSSSLTLKGEENDENDPSIAELVTGDRVLVKSDDPDYIYGNEDIAFMDDNEANVDSSNTEFAKGNLLKGFRKRITTKRQKALLETKRKRGRPPIKVGPIDCTDCDKVFDNVKDYRKHCHEHINSFACTFEDCVKRFKSQKDLDIHLRKHRGEKPYVCSECDKAYAIRQDLRLHIRTMHTGDRPYKCEMCPKAFARPHQLVVHLPVHTGERAHLCSECGNSFSSVSSLIDHRKRRHQMQRDHKCQTCPKVFFTRQELVAHNRTHTGDKPFQCQTCGKCFARPHHRKRHEAGVHNRERPQAAATSTSKTAKILLRSEDVAYETDTVLFTTDEMGETVLIKEVGYDDPYIIQQAKASTSADKDGGASGGGNPQFAANSLLQLSQMKTVDEETSVVIDADSVIEIPGQEGGFVFVTTSDNEQKLMPISQLSNFIAASSATSSQSTTSHQPHQE